MKRFIVIGNSMALDVSPGTPHVGMVPPDNGFIINAPDYVFEGWGYDARKKGDERFIKPRPPRGWAYDEASGTIYRVSDGVGHPDGGGFAGARWSPSRAGAAGSTRMVDSRHIWF